jgi:hypothetical protein
MSLNVVTYNRQEEYGHEILNLFYHRDDVAILMGNDEACKETACGSFSGCSIVL